MGLLYGETVSISSLYLSTLNQYAQLLGLSHQILSCLEMSKERSTFLSPERNSDVCNSEKGNVRKKHSRKPVLVKSSDGKESQPVKVSDSNNEYSLMNATAPEERTCSLQSKHVTDYHLPDALVDKADCDSALLELSMLCSDVQDMDTCSNNNWTIGHDRDEQMTYDQQSNSQIQEGTINTCNFVNSPSLEAVRNITIEASVEELNEKIENTSHVENEIDKNMPHASESTNDILSLVVDAENQVNLYCADTQQLQHQKKQQKNKSMGRGFMCPVCGSTFHRGGDLVKHVLNLQHFTPECPLCFIQVYMSICYLLLAPVLAGVLEEVGRCCL